MPLNFKTSFIVERVRRNNGVIETFFHMPGGKPDEYALFNTLTDRGEPKTGERYVITVKPEFPTDATARSSPRRA